MLNRSSSALKPWVVVIVGALVLALCAFFTLPGFSPDTTFAHEPTPAINHIHYAENGEEPIATFTSEDPENADVLWDVTGLDAPDFDISTAGVLTFKEPPNFESPTDRMPADDTATSDIDESEEETNNEYQITVRATEMRDSGDMDRALSTETDVTIIVDNVDEVGTIELRWLEPEVHTRISATLTDPDYPDGIPTNVAIAWTWHVSKVSGVPSATTPNHWTNVTTVTPDTDATVQPLPEQAITGYDIPHGTSDYVPVGVDAERRADGDDATDPGLPMHEGKYLRAVAHYDRVPGDEDGADDTAADAGAAGDFTYGMSANPARADRTTGDADDENGSPDFEPDTITITMDEDACVAPEAGGECTDRSWLVGSAIEAEDPNRRNPLDILTYELVRPENVDADRVDGRVYDVDSFIIDKASGQIMLAMPLNYEEDGRYYDDPGETARFGQESDKATYKFQIRATDPSGDSTLADITVKVTDMNDAPVIMGATELRVMEQDSDDLLPINNADGMLDNPYTGEPDMLERVPGSEPTPQVNTYTASDQDEIDQISWSVGGIDGDKFTLSADGVQGENEPRDLVFKPQFTPDFEAPTDADGDNVYKVTVMARDGSSGDQDRKMDEWSVTVIVENAEETGQITLEAQNGSGTGPVPEAQWEPFVDKMVTAAVDDPDEGVAIVTWQWSRSETGLDDSYKSIPSQTTANYTPSNADLGFFLRVTATYTDTYSGQEYADDPDTMWDERVIEEVDNNGTPMPKDPVDGTPPNGLHGDMGLYRVTATSAYAVRAEDEGPPTPSQPTPPVCPDVTVERSVWENAEAGTFVGDPIDIDIMCEGATSYSLVPDVRDNNYFSITSSMPARYILSEDETASEADVPPPTVPGWPQITVGSIEAPDGMMIDPPLDFEAKGGAPFIVQVTAENADGDDTFLVSITLMPLNESPWFNKASREMANTSLMFTENSMNLVATYRAEDPDGQVIVWDVTGRDADDFTIDGGVLRFAEPPDFENPTARAAAADRGAATTAGNTYMVTVRATEEMAVNDGGPDRYDELDVTVVVTDENENGMVNLSLLQAEVGTPLMATASDPDAITTGTAAYQWYRAKFDGEPKLAVNPDLFFTYGEGVARAQNAAFTAEWETISGTGDSAGNANPYTPQGREAQPGDDDNRTPGELTDRSTHPVDDPRMDPIDEYRYLLVVATYTDRLGADQTAVGVSSHPTRRDVHDDNNSSVDFADNEIEMMIQENMAGKGSRVGMVVVEDTDDEGDVITYELVEPSEREADTVYDVDFFAIDKMTGEITVKMDLDHEDDDGRTFDDPDTDIDEGEDPGLYVITVRATDPSGETTPADDPKNSDDVMVKVKVMDSNDAPRLVNGGVVLDRTDMNYDRDEVLAALEMNVELMVNEVNSSLEEDDDGYYTGLGKAAGQEMENLFRKIDHDAVDAPKTWLLEGRDGSFFELGTPGDGIGRTLHFRKPWPDYEKANDRNGDNVYEVTVVVIDSSDAENDRGEIPVTVEVMNVSEKGMLTLSPAEPTTGQMVTAELTDYDGVRSITSWMWEERTSSTGEWMVMDGATTDTVTGEVGYFYQATVEYRDGWSVEDDPVTDRVLDAQGPVRVDDERNEDDPRPRGGIDERLMDDTSFDSDERLMVALESAVRDPEVPTIEPGTPGTGTPPPTIYLTRRVYENVPGTGYAGDPLMEIMAGYEVDDNADGRYFRLANAIAEAYAASSDPDYNAPGGGATPENRQDKPGQVAVHWDPVPDLDAEAEKSSYTITIRDPNSPSSSPIELTIVVDNVNEAPSEPKRLIGGLAIGGSDNIRVDEGSLISEQYRVQGGQAGEQATWMLSGPDVGMFSISNTGELTFNGGITLSEGLDYEAPQDAGPVQNELQVTVELMVGDDSTSKFVTVTVVNVDEAGMVTLTPGVPSIGAEVMASLDDPDMSVTRLRWQWSRSDMADGPWTVIDGETADSYTPVEADRDMYLQAMAMYDDGQGSGKMAEESSPVASVPTFPSDEMTIMVDENTAEGMPVGEPVVAGAGMGAMLTYTLGGADASSFTIDDMGQIMVGTGTMLDYESGMTYEVTVTATDQNSDSDMVTVTITVVNVEEMGEVTLWDGMDPLTTPPQDGDVITGAVMDPDVPVNVTAWQWARTMTPDVMASWEDIQGETNAAYTVMATDAGYYLRVMATYTDAVGADTVMAYSPATMMVGADVTTPGDDLIAMYDGVANGGNGDGIIQKLEYLAALDAFLDGDIDRDALLEVLDALIDALDALS